MFLSYTIDEFTENHQRSSILFCFTKSSQIWKPLKIRSKLMIFFTSSYRCKIICSEDNVPNMQKIRCKTNTCIIIRFKLQMNKFVRIVLVNSFII